MRKIFFGILQLVIIMVFLFPSQGVGKTKYEGSLIFGVASAFKNVDPHKTRIGTEGLCYTLMYNTLVESGKNYEPRPGLAESWEVSSDGKTWIFHLRKGVKFHNGREMTSEDIKFNIERIMNPKTGSRVRSRFENVDSVNCSDPLTVTFQLKKPTSNFVVCFYGDSHQASIIAPECVKEDGTVEHPIGTGPFQFVEWKSHEHIKLKKFVDYWKKGLPYLDEIILKPVPDQTVRFAALKAGDLDMTMNLPIDEVSMLMKKPPKDFVFSTESTEFPIDIRFNCSKPPFSDKKIRQAVAYGINKKEILMGVYQGYGEVINQPFPTDSPHYYDVPDIKRDVKKAKALIKEAGYPNGIEVTYTTATYPTFKAQAEIIQAQLSEIGMNVKLDLSDLPTFIKKIFKGEWSFGGATYAVVADPDLVYPSLYDPNSHYAMWLGKYNNPQMTDLLKQARIAIRPEKKKELYTKVVELMLQEAPNIWTVRGQPAWGWRSYVKGFDPHLIKLLRYADGGLQYVWIDR